jgi:hypothetical protein
MTRTNTTRTIKVLSAYNGTSPMLKHILFVESVGKYWYVYETQIFSGAYIIKPSEFTRKEEFDPLNPLEYRNMYLRNNMMFRKDLV